MLMELHLDGRASPFIFMEELGSTNTTMKELAMQGAQEGTVLMAARQTGGRGRMDRSFISPEGGIYLSMLLTPRCSPEESLSLTPCAAVAVCRSVEKLCGIKADIKWPNDLLVNGKKVCGILCESLFFNGQQKLILGIGLNVSTPQEAFAGELGNIAGSILSLTGSAPAVEAMAAELISQLDGMYERWQADPRCFLEEYRRSCVNIGKKVSIMKDGMPCPATAIDIDENYALTVEYPNGERVKVYMGEVSLRSV